ncbi:MAG: HigA family addiction module antidote protein [Candidatus Margulisbacteria bacterium]|jgi:addiction module HigA family antidote|nr:HigA family addiction module antidote protein [Candidatus Margulisiibacteriota bacterium]
MENNVPTVGEVLEQEFIKPFGLSQNNLAKALGIPQNRISNIINGKCGVSADTDLRLCKYFGLTEGYFSGLQMDFELIKARQAIAPELRQIAPIRYLAPEKQTPKRKVG